MAKLRMASFAGHRGWVREGGVPHSQCLNFELQFLHAWMLAQYTNDVFAKVNENQSVVIH